jgi:hypothetical protein
MTTFPEFALSIRQPWAWAILSEGKDVENRTWSTRFRGPVLIHAGMALDKEGALAISDVLGCNVDAEVAVKHLPRGGIVGMADIVDCVTDMDSPWFFGPYGFVLRNPQPLKFVPCRGALGFFKPAIDTTGPYTPAGFL